MGIINQGIVSELFIFELRKNRKVHWKLLNTKLQ